jgi:hypothetical protein
MIRSHRKGFAARTGFTDVKEASALLAQVIDRHKKRFSAFPGWPVDLPLRSAAPLSWGGCSAAACSSDQADERIQKLQCRATLAFCARKTNFDRSTPEASEVKSERGNNRTDGTT